MLKIGGEQCPRTPQPPPRGPPAPPPPPPMPPPAVEQHWVVFPGVRGSGQGPSPATMPAPPGPPLASGGLPASEPGRGQHSPGSAREHGGACSTGSLITNRGIALQPPSTKTGQCSGDRP